MINKKEGEKPNLENHASHQPEENKADIKTFANLEFLVDVLRNLKAALNEKRKP